MQCDSTKVNDDLRIAHLRNQLNPIMSVGQETKYQICHFLLGESGQRDGLHHPLQYYSLG